MRDYLDEDDELDENFNINNIDEDDDIEETPKKETKKRMPQHIGKHSLKRDNIFKPTETIKLKEFDDNEYINEYVYDSFQIDSTNQLHYNTDNNEDELRLNSMREKIRYLMEQHTELNLGSKRRKPARTDFNVYYQMCLNELSEYGYSKTEIFLELAGYFTIESYWNMFLLLEKKYADDIISELGQKYGLNVIKNMDIF